jgi:hypothetical protein
MVAMDFLERTIPEKAALIYSLTVLQMPFNGSTSRLPTWRIVRFRVEFFEWLCMLSREFLC